MTGGEILALIGVTAMLALGIAVVVEMNSWRVVKDTGVWSYEEHVRSGKRRIVQVGGGFQPKDHAWLERGGEPYAGPKSAPPVGPLPDKGGAGRRPPFLDPWGE